MLIANMFATKDGFLVGSMREGGALGVVGMIVTGRNDGEDVEGRLLGALGIRVGRDLDGVIVGCVSVGKLVGLRVGSCVGENGA
jgi:hypothetical protein